MPFFQVVMHAVIHVVIYAVMHVVIHVVIYAVMHVVMHAVIHAAIHVVIYAVILEIFNPGSTLLWRYSNVNSAVRIYIRVTAS